MLARLDAEDAKAELKDNQRDPSQEASEISDKIRELRHRRATIKSSMSRSPADSTSQPRSAGSVEDPLDKAFEKHYQEQASKVKAGLSREEVTQQAKARVAKLVEEAKTAAEKKFSAKVLGTKNKEENQFDARQKIEKIKAKLDQQRSDTEKAAIEDFKVYFSADGPNLVCCPLAVNRGLALPRFFPSLLV